MDEIEQLTKQVQLLAETVKLMTDRMEQVFKMIEDRISGFPQLAENQQKAIEELMTTDEALKQSLDESDQQIDDLSKVVAALLLIQEKMEEKQPNDQSEG